LASTFWLTSKIKILVCVPDTLTLKRGCFRAAIPEKNLLAYKHNIKKEAVVPVASFRQFA
jgi:hypothetical protein